MFGRVPKTILPRRLSYSVLMLKKLLEDDGKKPVVMRKIKRTRKVRDADGKEISSIVERSEGSYEISFVEHVKRFYSSSAV